ncbi:hypothetical protein EV122DRAFT_219827 [Schizophyllum commune]
MYNVGESTTPWARRFDQAIAPYNTNPSALDLQFLGSPIVKESHARLNPSKIPRPPMRPSDVRPIDEAVQALLAYEPLLSAATVRGGAVAKEAYTIFDHIWKWIVYLRPSTANVGDNGLPDNARPVYDGGDIYLGMQPLWLSFRRYLACALAHKEGRKRCLAQSDFVAVTLEIFTFESPLLEPQDIVPRAYSSHRVVLGLAGLLGDRKLTRRLTADICAYDQQNPGSFLRSLLKEMESLLSTEIYHSFTTAYTSLTSALLANNEILERFLKVRPEPSLTEPADNGIVEICHSLHATVSRDNFQNTAAALLLAEHWITQITSISRTYTGDVDILKEALDGGIVRYLVNACLDPRDQFRPSEWQAPGVAFVLDVLTPALFRPKYLPALEKAAKEPSVQSADMNDIQLASPELARLLLRIPILERHRQTMKAVMKRTKHCHNGDSCPRSAKRVRKLKMCMCGRAFYCSRKCQKAHWQEHKPQCCDADARVHMKSEQSEVTLTHFDRCFLKMVAWNDANEAGLHSSRSIAHYAGSAAVLLDYSEGPKPQLRIMDDPLRPGPIYPSHVYAKVRHWPGDAIIFMGFLGNSYW